MNELAEAFADLTDDERHGIAVTATRRRDEYAAVGERWSRAWAQVYAVLAASAAEASARQARALYDIERASSINADRVVVEYDEATV